MFGRTEAKKNRFYVGKGMPGVRAAWYRLINKAYLDIRVFRGYRKLTRIVTTDTGMETFNLDGIGTFLLPKDEHLLRLFHDRNALYIDYNVNTSAPGEVVEHQDWCAIRYPPLSPKDFSTHLNQQTVTDLLTEQKKDMSWVWMLLLAAIAIVVIVIMFGGVT